MDDLKERLQEVHGMYEEGLITKEELVNKVVDITYQWAQVQ